MLASVAGGCSTGAHIDRTTTTFPADVSDATLRSVSSTWVNMTGLRQLDPAVWRRRLDEACTQGVWDKTVAVELATKYIAEDEAAFLSGRTPDQAPTTVEDAADALWLMALQVCRDTFPADAIEAGPPFNSETHQK